MDAKGWLKGTHRRRVQPGDVHDSKSFLWWKQEPLVASLLPWQKSVQPWQPPWSKSDSATGTAAPRSADRGQSWAMKRTFGQNWAKNCVINNYLCNIDYESNYVLFRNHFHGWIQTVASQDRTYSSSREAYEEAAERCRLKPWRTLNGDWGGNMWLATLI